MCCLGGFISIFWEGEYEAGMLDAYDASCFFGVFWVVLKVCCGFAFHTTYSLVL